MYKFALCLAVIAATGCSTVDTLRYGEKSTTPIPKEEFMAVGNYRHKAGALEIATDNAKAFCGRWRASPAIISQATIKTQNDNLSKSIKRSVTTALTNEGSANDLYETTIKYKCY